MRLRITGFLAAALMIGALLLMAYVRFAASDVTRWHVALSTQGPATPGPCAAMIEQSAASARATCLLADPPAAVLARLDALAAATPRSQRLAGSPDSGLITWITRSRLWGFPDYTTAQAIETDAGTRLDIFARARFGQGDWGVNRARLQDWLAPF